MASTKRSIFLTVLLLAFVATISRFETFYRWTPLFSQYTVREDSVRRGLPIQKFLRAKNIVTTLSEEGRLLVGGRHREDALAELARANLPSNPAILAFDSSDISLALSPPPKLHWKYEMKAEEAFQMEQFLERVLCKIPEVKSATVKFDKDRTASQGYYIAEDKRAVLFIYVEAVNPPKSLDLGISKIAALSTGKQIQPQQVDVTVKNLKG